MKKYNIADAKGDRALYITVNIILFLILLIVAIPLMNVIACSLSGKDAVAAGRVFLWPVDFSLEGYKIVLKNKDVLTGYINSFFYMIAGTVLNVFMTVIAAYPLSRSDLKYKGIIIKLFMFTMLFGGGMIPSYILMKNLGLIDNRLVMIIPGALSVYNMIITITFFKSSIPSELLDAARIDGCSDIKYFVSIVLPLSKAILAVLTLYYAVGHWNSYFNAIIYLNSREKYPLTIFLREILLVNTMSAEMIFDPETMAQKQNVADLLKYSLIIISSLPVWCIYPFVQNYFIKGVMLGSVKG